MGGAASKYKVHPGRDDGEGRRKRALLDQNHVSASVVTMIKKDSEVSRFYREKEQAVSRIGMSEEECQARLRARRHGVRMSSMDNRHLHRGIQRR